MTLPAQQEARQLAKAYPDPSRHVTSRHVTKCSVALPDQRRRELVGLIDYFPTNQALERVSVTTCELAQLESAGPGIQGEQIPGPRIF